MAKISNIKKLYNMIKENGEMSKAAIIQWGLNNGDLRAARNARKLVEKKYLEAISYPGKAQVYYRYITKEKLLCDMVNPLKQVGLGI
jgi:hypothetical protein